MLREYLAKLCKVHGGRHPELFEIAAEFDACAHAMAAHMKKEELLLFPFIKQLEKARAEGMPTPHPHFGTVSNPIAAMMHDHDAEGERFRRIKELSCGYAEPADGCATYHTAMAMLQVGRKDGKGVSQRAWRWVRQSSPSQFSYPGLIIGRVIVWRMYRPSRRLVQ